jgi:hypothetical protein
LDDLVEEAAGVLGLDLLLNPPVRCAVRNVGLVGRACAAGEDSDDATISAEDDGPGVATIGELAAPVVIRQDGDLDGDFLDAVLNEVAGEGLETIDATDGGPRGQPILHDEQALLAMDIKVLRVANLIMLDNLISLEETIHKIPVLLSINDLKKHNSRKFIN